MKNVIEEADGNEEDSNSGLWRYHAARANLALGVFGERGVAV